jgi:predicted alpha/beta-fold hydrolase
VGDWADGRLGFRVEPYRPAVWLPSPHGQTIAGRYLRRRRPPEFERVRVDTPDGDFLDLDFAVGPNSDGPCVILFHGLEGSARRGYAINTYLELRDRGITSVGVNFRSCSGELNRNARFYHSGETEDIGFAIDCVRKRWPGRPVGAIGFSLGGNALLKFLGETGDASPLDCAVAVSVPYDLGAGARLLDSNPMGRFYSRHFVKSLTVKAEAKIALLQDTCDFDRIRAARSFFEFDDAVTAPLHGFAGANDYYTRSSSAQFIERIRRPVLLLHAQDDPFVPFAAVPQRNTEFVTVGITETGGHVGFIEGWPWSPGFWAERQAARFFASCFGE